MAASISSTSSNFLTGQESTFTSKNEDTSDRLLTGFDFDLESFVVAFDVARLGWRIWTLPVTFDATGKL